MTVFILIIIVAANFDIWQHLARVGARKVEGRKKIYLTGADRNSENVGKEKQF